MKAVIFSGNSKTQNDKLNKELIILANKSNSKIRIGYVPSCSDQDSKYYKKFKSHFKKYGINNYYFLPLKNFNEKTKEKMFNCDIIYFDGGNTFNFLEELRSNKYIETSIKEYSKKGIIAGQSAGIIILTNNINMASIPSIDSDENEYNSKKTKGLNLFKFETSPHFTNSKVENKELLEYSKTTNRDIFAIEDGSGIVINKSIKCLGNVYKFQNGKRYKISI